MSIAQECITFQQAHKYIENTNVADYIFTLTENYNLSYTDDIFQTNISAVHNIIVQLEEYLSHIQNNSPLIASAAYCVMFNQIHNSLIAIIFKHFDAKDKHIANKCLQLGNLSISPELFGASKFHGVQFDAAVVELCDLDNRNSPTEKIWCLITTYDLIYAELKSHFIEIDSTYHSDADNLIPVVDNSDVLPILMMVIVKSKPLHIFSNIYYINAFLADEMDKRCTRKILAHFEEAVKALEETSVQLLNSDHKVQTYEELSLVKIIKMSISNNTATLRNNTQSPFSEQRMNRVMTLIQHSTNEMNQHQ